MVIKKSIFLFFFIVIFLANVSLIQAQKYEDFQNWGENAKVYLLFMTRGYRITVGSSLEEVDYLTNDEVLKQLQEKCKGVDFIVRDLSKFDRDSRTIELESVQSELMGVKYGCYSEEDLSWCYMSKPIPELKGSEKGIDGVVIFGHPRPYGLAFTGLPTIVVENLFEVIMEIQHMLFNRGEKEEGATLVGGPDYTGGKILTAEIDRRNACPPNVRQAMFDDIVYKIHLIRAIKQVKESRILYLKHTSSNEDYFGNGDYRAGSDTHVYFPDEFNMIIASELKEKFGTELVMIHPEELYQAFKNTDFKRAEEIATIWINQAIEMKFTTKSEVIRTARIYLAMEELRKKYNCNAIITMHDVLKRAIEVAPEDEPLVSYWSGLALIEFQKRGIMAMCQDYINIIIPHLLGFYLTGQPSMMGNHVLDHSNNIEILTHCGAPMNIYGNKPFLKGQEFMRGYKPDTPTRNPYILWSHAESSMPPGAPGSSTGIQIFFPINVPVTVWKMDMMNKRFGFHTGTSVDGYAVYNELDFDIWCRTKLCVDTNVKNVESHYSSAVWGRHRAGIFTDLSKEINDLAIFYGFKAVDEVNDLPNY